IAQVSYPRVFQSLIRAPSRAALAGSWSNIAVYVLSTYLPPLADYELLEGNDFIQISEYVGSGPDITAVL
ncbi:hypothetical protein, partial [Klebsiella quasipneumoniae]|uniref:hypothetical protein n=1 Tax=Klebsiella quasipneumoniae TaxID=1463165 RepID=UPI002731C7D0